MACPGVREPCVRDLGQGHTVPGEPDCLLGLGPGFLETTRVLEHFRRGDVRHGRRPVLAEAVLLAQPKCGLGEPYGVVRLASLGVDRRQAAVPVDDGEVVAAASRTSDGLGERGLCNCGVALPEEGDAHHRAADRPPRRLLDRLELARPARDLDRPADVALHVAVDAAEHAGGGLVGGRILLGGGLRRDLDRPDPPVDLVDPALVDGDPRSRQAESGILGDGLRRQRVEPVGDRPELAALKEAGPVEGDQVGGVLEVAGGGRVMDRLGDEAVVAEPAGGSSMEVLDRLDPAELQLESEQVREQLVIAIPPALLVQRDEEELRTLDALEHSRRAFGLGHGVAQRA